MDLKDVVRRSWLLPFLFLTACQSSVAFPSLQKIWEKIIWIGTLGFLGTPLAAEGFMRIMVFILVFALLFEGSRRLGLQRKQRNIQITISLVLAIIATIFMPKGVLAGVGVAYGTVVSFFLIGIPVAAGLYAIYVLPSTNRWLIGIKIAIIMLLLILLILIKNFAIAGLGLP